MVLEVIKIKKRKEVDLSFVKYGDIRIIKGEISDNIFAIPKYRTQAVQWCVIPENKAKIMKKLRYLFFHNKDGVYKGSIEDCYIYVLNYFMKPDKVFYKNYSEQSKESEYTIEQYIMFNIKNVFNMYKSDLNNKESYTHNTESAIKKYSGGEEYSVFEIVADNNNFFEKVDNKDEYKLNFLKLKVAISDFMIKNKYNINLISDLDSFIYLLFLEPPTEELAFLPNMVSDKLNIPKQVIDLLLNDLKKKYQQQDIDAINIFNLLNKLIILKK